MNSLISEVEEKFQNDEIRTALLNEEAKQDNIEFLAKELNVATAETR